MMRLPVGLVTNNSKKNQYLLLRAFLAKNKRKNFVFFAMKTRNSSFLMKFNRESLFLS